MKFFKDYVVGEIISYRGNRYEVAAKRVRTKFIKMAGQSFSSNILYLRALDTPENRVARVNSRGVLEFNSHELFKHKPTKDEGRKVYESWKTIPIVI